LYTISIWYQRVGTRNRGGKQLVFSQILVFVREIPTRCIWKGLGWVRDFGSSGGEMMIIFYYGWYHSYDKYHIGWLGDIWLYCVDDWIFMKIWSILGDSSNLYWFFLLFYFNYVSFSFGYYLFSVFLSGKFCVLFIWWLLLFMENLIFNEK
jgi:hypothetical protein